MQRRIRFAEDLPKGTANTVLFAEKYAACSAWAATEGDLMPLYLPSPESGFQVRPSVCDPRLPQSPHNEGINVAMADGSLRLVRHSISPAVWFAAHTAAGGADRDGW